MKATVRNRAAWSYSDIRESTWHSQDYLKDAGPVEAVRAQNGYCYVGDRASNGALIAIAQMPPGLEYTPGLFLICSTPDPHLI